MGEINCFQENLYKEAQGMSQKNFWIGALLLAIIGLFIGQSYIYHVFILCFIWIIVVVGWDLVLGYCGILNFAQLVFFASAAYGTGMLSINLNLNPLLSIFLSVALTGVIGLIVGLPCLRLKGEYVALFSFAVHLALPALISQGRSIGTGGATGLMGIPSIQLFGFSFTVMEKMSWYYLSFILAGLVVYCIYFVLIPGRLGRAFIALRDSEDFARSIGINDYKYKLTAFVISAITTGIAGALYAHYVSVVTPKILGNEFFLMVMLMLSVGGIGRFPGVLLGAFIITFGNELLRDAGQYRLLILGLCVVVTILYLPNGVVYFKGKFISRILHKKKQLSE
jgi:branched-chain amino acid transport system permease protein